ncbi:hypothetical protein N7456_000070 [Penicillium angulare]|uniref:Mitochondrial export protein Som1 n=1 Tax=Penicillium angulare TaxID=116970 RepID=A0A9W9GBD9_9EURO|nr:hypothetical protein N7456_000070 [Penicillium angulare]
MAPLVPVFSADTLPDHVNIVRRNFLEKKRKGTQIDLKECPLLEMTQYSCNPPQEALPQPGQVVCKPIVRLFRKCADGLTVETTSWEPLRQAEEAKANAKLESRSTTTSEK